MVDKYSNSFDISAADLQFLVSIALGTLGLDHASDCVLSMFKDTPELRNNLYNSIKETKEKNDSDIKAYIRYLFLHKCVPTVTNGVRRVCQSVSLAEMLPPHISVESLHGECMRILMTTVTNDLIGAYANTQTFKKAFSGFFMQDVTDVEMKAAYLEMSQEDKEVFCDRVYAVFVERAELYWGNERFSSDTCTPVAYLRNAYRLYFLADRQITTFMRNCLYQHGQDLVQLDGKSTALSVIGIDVDSAKPTLDFKVIAAKIQRASEVLFWHNRGTLIYSSIVAYYRKHLIDKSVNGMSKVFKKLVGIKVNTKALPEEITLDDNTLVQKYKTRTQYCDILERSILQGKNPDMSALYDELYKASLAAGDKNAVRLFGVNGSSITQSCATMKNGEIFQALVEGYLAFKKLLIYIKEINNPDITIFSLPDLIFRDARYARRFNTLEEYVHFFDTVRDLKELKDKEPPIIDYGLRSNDFLYDSFCIPGIMQSSKIKTWINANPIINLRQIVENHNIEAANTNYSMHTSTLRGKFKQCIFTGRLYETSSGTSVTADLVLFNEKKLTLPLAEWQKILDGIATQFISAKQQRIILIKPEDGNSNVLSQLIMLGVLYICVFSHMAELIGAPIVVSGRYKPCNESITDYIGRSLGEKASEGMLSYFREREQEFTYVYAAFFGKMPADIEDRACLLELFMAASVLQYYYMGLYEMTEMLQSLSTQGDYLLLVKANAYKDFLDMPQHITSISELRGYQSSTFNLSGADNTDGLNKLLTAINNAKTSCVLAYNRMAASLHIIVPTLELLRNGVHNHESFNLGQLPDILEVNAILDNKKAAIAATTGAIDAEIQSKLNFLPHDDMCYVLDGKSRLCIDGTYYLTLGYKVVINQINEAIETRMTLKQAEDLITTVQLRSRR